MGNNEKEMKVETSSKSNVILQNNGDLQGNSNKKKDAISTSFEDSPRFTYKKKNFAWRMKQPFSHFPSTFKSATPTRKLGMLLNTILPGTGSMVVGAIEYGLVILACFVGLLIGEVYLSIFLLDKTISLSVFNTIVIYVILNAGLIALYYSSFKTCVGLNEKLNYGFEIDRFLIFNLLKRGVLNLIAWFKNYKVQYKAADKRNKTLLGLSFFIMGVPLLFFKQALKGVFLLVVQVLSILFLIARGVSDIENFFMMINDRTPSNPLNPIIYGIIAFLILFFFIAMYFVNLSAVLKCITNDNEKRKNETTVDEFKDLVNKKFYISGLVIPIVGAIVFTIIPLLFMILIAFTNYSQVKVDGYNNSGTLLEWVGLSTFKRLFSIGANFQDLISVFSWTMIWATLATFTCYFGGLFLAMLLNKKCIKGKVVFRSAFVIAMALPQFVSLLVVRTMFMDYGPINQLLISWGWISEFTPYWETEFTAKMLIIFINMWVGIPYYMLLMSGLLINIPKDYYEAATIEGASKMQQFQRITFPNILFMTTPLLITSFVSNINNFNVIYFLTNGGTGIPSSPSGTAAPTDILITWLYNLTMKKYDYNFGAAIGIIMFIITATLSLVIFRKSKAYNSEEEYR